jgi:hypothetical protein
MKTGVNKEDYIFKLRTQEYIIYQKDIQKTKSIKKFDRKTKQYKHKHKHKPNTTPTQTHHNTKRNYNAKTRIIFG